ncbi:uncharacterized protein LOC134217050 [Armigeres subalbatus]|uniref:uncharacterized protein LOC134217050 n=1 Tax=Armigeres subalbatus TaxID=124917 RepID=UPI002ED69CEC
MKFISIVLIIYLAVSSYAHLTSKQYDTVKDIAVLCAKELEIKLRDGFLMPGFYEGALFDDVGKNKQFIACFLNKMGAVSLGGQILGSKVLEFMADEHDQANLKVTVEKCVAVGGDTLEERAYNFHKCFWEERMDESK